jgi:hypothetical protein
VRATCPHPPWPNHILWRVQVIKLHMTQCFPAFCHFVSLVTIYSEVPKLWGAVVLLGGGGVCTKDILILNKILAKDEIYISVGTLLGWNILLVSTGTGSELQVAYKQLILSPAKMSFLCRYTSTNKNEVALLP